MSLALGAAPLLEGVDLALVRRERVCLVGRNGEGKTTLLRVLAGELPPDEGEVRRGAEIRVASLPQTFPPGLPDTVQAVVAEGLGPLGHLVSRLAAAADPQARAALEAELGRREGWDLERQCRRWCEAARLDPGARTAALSGGQLRRALIARALVSGPDVLVLDEPTNHLDLPGIEWLEQIVEGFAGSVVFTTHDRAFLRRVATRIVELDRGALTSWPGDYDNYLRRRAEREEAEARAQTRLVRRLEEEERWIRTGIMARRTRNEGRVRRLEALREARRRRRDRPGEARFSVQEAERSGQRVIEAENVTFGFGNEAPLVEGFSCIIQRGDKVGVIGPNGSGKTTLLRLLLGELVPGRGQVRRGSRLRVAYFDQRREQLDDDARVADCVADGADHVTVGGESRHVIGYLQDFLFSPDRARQPVRALSGGERNRLLLARLFARPSNLLVLDEPTNDLDVETLELLEALLVDYQGTLLVVSHDREFLDNVVTGTLVLEGDGRVGEYVGGYSDYVRARAAATAHPPVTSAPHASRPGRERRPAEGATRKRTYGEQRELDALPARIEALEREVEHLQATLSDPGFYRQAGEVVAEHTAALRDAEARLAASYERWATLEAT